MVVDKSQIHLYGAIIIISIIIGIAYIYLSLRKDRINDNRISLYFLMYITFSIIMGKQFTLLTSHHTNFLTVGLSSYGGGIGVILSAYIFEKILPLNNQLKKYAIISLPLVYSISKIACFVSGCCFGIPYDGVGHIIYKDGLNIPVFPIQIVETIVFFIIFLYCNNKRKSKNIIEITILICSIAKGLLDFLRYEHLTKIITFNQIISIIVCLLLLIEFIYKKKLVNK